MLKYFFIAFSFFLIFGCEKKNPVESFGIENQILHGTFKITYNIGTSQEYFEQGSISMMFENNSYNYTGEFSDTSIGRGHIFKDGIQDSGNYLVSDNTISLNDAAIIYGVGTPIGSPSLYLSSDFQINVFGNKISFIKEDFNKRILIFLSK